MKEIIIGSDLSGFDLKEATKKHLTETGYTVTDCGTLEKEAAQPYFQVAEKLGKRMCAGEFQKGILICGTGMGMSIVANKFPGVYAAVCDNTYAAEKARAINDANVLTLGGWITAEVSGINIVDTFLKTEFTENLEDWRAANLRKAKTEIQQMEKRIMEGEEL